MTDQELIKALRCCISYANCDMCQSECIFYKDPKSSECIPAMGETVIARLEALLAENEGLKAQVPKWVSVEEQLPVLTEREIREIEKFGIEGAPEFIVQIIGADRPTVLMFDGEKWVDHDGNWYSITRWMAIPGVEGVGK